MTEYETEIGKIERYIEGYREPRTMMDVAYGFYDLGERTLEADIDMQEVYVKTVPFIHGSLMIAKMNGKIAFIDVDVKELDARILGEDYGIGESETEEPFDGLDDDYGSIGEDNYMEDDCDDWPEDYSQSEDRVVSLYECRIILKDKHRYPLHDDSLIFSYLPPSSEDHYGGFLEDCVVVSNYALNHCKHLEPNQLLAFVGNAYKLGLGMGVDEAISARHDAIQKMCSCIEEDTLEGKVTYSLQ